MSHTRQILFVLGAATLVWSILLLTEPAESTPDVATPTTTTTQALFAPAQPDDRVWIQQALRRAAETQADRDAWYAAAAAAEAERAAREAEERAERERQARAAREAEEARREAESVPVAATPAPGSNYERFLRLADCESGQRDGSGRPIPGTANWHINTGNGYYGGLQFSLDTWRRAGGTGYPHEHSRDTQIAIAESWLARTSWSQWPACSRMLGYR